jgi:hypothetical protein
MEYERYDHWAWPSPPLPKNVWGALGWNWLHALAINYPARPSLQLALETHRRIWVFLRSLPCMDCQAHSTRYFTLKQPDLRNAHALQQWALDFHNAVNARLGKPQVSYREYLRLYADEIRRAEHARGRH